MQKTNNKNYIADNAQLMAEWNWEKNTEFDPNQITHGSHKKVWWKCCNDHEWQATIHDRNNGRGCPYCSGKRVLKGYNDLQTLNPNLAKEWNYEKNADLTPDDVTPGSNKKVWWKCNKGHEWQATINIRNRVSGCPYCAGQKVLKGYNDLQTVNSTIAKEWNYEKNNGLIPADITPGSSKKVWWKCSKGHEWQARVPDRHKGKDCPYCAGQKVIKGENDLQTVNPTLAKEWHYEKNNGLTPEDVMPNSGKKVWWKCDKGHEWQATVSSRNIGRGCPLCSSEQRTSFPEYAIVHYLTKQGLEVIHSYKEQGYELDIYIPSKKVAIEYDGYYWHENKAKKDLAKNQKCKKDGIKLYRIREELPPLNDSSIDYVVQKKQKNLSKILAQILGEIIGTSVDIDIERDAIDIESLREYTEKQHSLFFKNTEIAKEWNYERNGELKPQNISASSNKKVWWKCCRGHEWQARIDHRNNGSGCPYCSGKKVLKGFNDLQTLNSVLAKEWNYKKNNDLTPADVTPNSNKKVWWECSNGHEWQSIIADRNKGRGCPICRSKKVKRQ